VPEVRVFKGRDSMGVRGINLADGDAIISMAILRHMEATGEERAGYLKMRRAITGEQANGEGANGETAAVEGEEEAAVATAETLPMERYTEMSAHEQFILTLSERGFGKRTSSYEYRITGRGGKGITAMAVNDRNGQLVGSFPVENEDQIMLVTNAGQLIRVPVDGIRIVGRNSQGVTVFATKGKEKVVSVEHIEGEDAEATDEGDPIIGEDGGPASSEE
jgi:DNA gyrase subunit A